MPHQCDILSSSKTQNGTMMSRSSYGFNFPQFPWEEGGAKCQGNSAFYNTCWHLWFPRFGCLYLYISLLQKSHVRMSWETPQSSLPDLVWEPPWRSGPCQDTESKLWPVSDTHPPGPSCQTWCLWLSLVLPWSCYLPSCRWPLCWPRFLSLALPCVPSDQGGHGLSYSHHPSYGASLPRWSVCFLLFSDATASIFKENCICKIACIVYEFY